MYVIRYTCGHVCFFSHLICLFLPNCCFFFLVFFLLIPFITFALVFSRSSYSRNSDPGSHSRLGFSPSSLPTTVRALEGIFIATKLRPFLPSSTTNSIEAIEFECAYDTQATVTINLRSQQLIPYLMLFLQVDSKRSTGVGFELHHQLVSIQHLRAQYHCHRGDRLPQTLREFPPTSTVDPTTTRPSRLGIM